MADFTSSFWSIFIAVVTLVSLAGVLWLSFANRSTTSAPNETTGRVWDEDLTEFDNPLPTWWLYLLYLTVAFGLVYLILYPGLGSFQGALNWSQIGQYETEIAAAEEKYGAALENYGKADVTELAKDAAAIKTASRLFAQNCAVCHGSDARGAPGIPNLRDDDWIWGNDPQTILTTILNGRTGVMPGWEAVLGGREATVDVAHYVLQLSGQSADTERAARGEQKFKMICIACHGMDGSGSPMLGGMNLTDNVWVHGSTVEEISDIIGNGVQNQMPAHIDLLGEVKSKLLAAYVISLSN